jgi:hypothetical protein
MDRESIVFALWWTGEEEAFKPISLLAAWPLCPLYITILVLLVSERTCLLDIFIKMKSCDCFRQAQQYYFPIRFDLGHGSWSNQRAKLTPLAQRKVQLLGIVFPQRSITSGVTVDSSWVQLLQTVHNTCAALNRVFLIGFWFPCLLNHVMRRTKCWKNLASSQNITLQERQIMCKFRSPYAIMHLVGLTPPACTHTYMQPHQSPLMPHAGHTHNSSSTSHGHMSSLHKREESCAAIIIQRNRILARQK